MSHVVLVRTLDGVRGMTASDDRCFERFQECVEALPVSGTLSFTWTEPRSPYWHRRHFAMIRRVFDAQDPFDHPDRLRAWLTVGAGHCDILPGPNGERVAIPRSIGYDALSEEAFAQHHRRCMNFLLTPHALHFLLPRYAHKEAADIMTRLVAAREDDGDGPSDA